MLLGAPSSALADDGYYDGYYYGPDYCGGYYGSDCYGGGYYGDNTASTFLAHMTADQEVPKPGPPGAKGNATLDVDRAAHRVCFKLTYQGIDRPTAAHIHHGFPGRAGPVAVDLHLEANGNEGCVGAPYGVISAIQAHPHDFYLNVHTKDFPDGAMRGQLYYPGEAGYP